ncbi:hypothetical protein DI273_01950 [Streptomyces violascens]|nr:hypothetical protein DI273_01950 [Streptomyces violascens]
MLREVVGLFRAGALELLPRQEWDVRRAGEAFALMSRAKHVGKLVLSVPLIPGASPSEGEGVGVGGWVLVSGGSGVLGGVVARHLVRERGVRRLVLLSRSGEVGSLVGSCRVWVLRCGRWCVMWRTVRRCGVWWRVCRVVCRGWCMRRVCWMTWWWRGCRGSGWRVCWRRRWWVGGICMR